MASFIEIIFNSQPAADTQVTIIDSLTGTSMIETFKATRSGIGESAIGVDLEHTSFNYKQAIEADYNNAFLYSIDYDLANKKITINATNASSQFSVDSNTTAGAVTTNISNDTPPSTFTIDTVTVLEADSSPCDNVKISVETSEQSDNISSPISQAVATNPFEFTTVRAESISISMVLNAETVTKKYRIPKLLSTYININIVNTPSGATVTANRQFPLSDIAIQGVTFPLTFQYSLDGVTWQTSNSWSGIAVGNHTLYVKDNIGCQISIPFEVTEFTPNLVDYDPIFEVSNLNSIRFKKEVTWSEAVPKNIDNTLSHEEDVYLNRRDFTQPFQTNDLETIQIKSNYETNEAVLIDCDGNETALTVSKMSSLMDITDVRDAYIINFSGDTNDGKLGVYFGAGNVYNPITQAYESTYNLGGNLMSWVNIGDYINLNGIGWVLIEKIVTIPDYIPFLGKALVLNVLHADYGLTNQSSIKATTVYNERDYERYEIPVDFSALDGFYQVRITGTDTRTEYQDVSYLSEYLNIKVTHLKMDVFDYYNTENNEINFNTGIQFRLRVPRAELLKRIPKNKQENYETDINTVKIKSDVRKLYEYKSPLLPSAMTDKLELVLSQDRLFINGVSYLSEGDINIEQFGDTNLCQITATLIKSDYVFDSTSGIGIGEQVLQPAEPLEPDPNAQGLLFLD